MKYPYLLFDADDTLFDFSAAERHAHIRMCQLHRIPYSEENYALYHRINSQLWHEFDLGQVTKPFLLTERFRRWLEALHLTGDPDTMQRDYAAALGESTILLPGALELCRALACDHEMYILTNAVACVQRARFAKSELTPYFKDVFISETVGFSKPNAAFFDHVLGAIPGITRENSLVIGDSLSSDIKGANNAGIPCLWLNRKNQPCPDDIHVDYEAHDLPQILQIIRQLDQQ